MKRPATLSATGGVSPPCTNLDRCRNEDRPSLPSHRGVHRGKSTDRSEGIRHSVSTVKGRIVSEHHFAGISLTQPAPPLHTYPTKLQDSQKGLYPNHGLAIPAPLNSFCESRRSVNLLGQNREIKPKWEARYRTPRLGNNNDVPIRRQQSG